MTCEYRRICPVCACEFRGDERRVTCSMQCRAMLPPRVMAPKPIKARDSDRWWRLFGREAAAARLAVRA